MGIASLGYALNGLGNLVAPGNAPAFAGAGHNLHRERPREVVKVILNLLPGPQ